MSPDLFNGAFEIGGAVLLGLDLRALWRDRSYTGVHWGPRAFFTAWGFWNLFYYPHLDQWFSFVGGIAVVSVNAAWLGLAGWLAWRVERRG